MSSGGKRSRVLAAALLPFGILAACESTPPSAPPAPTVDYTTLEVPGAVYEPIARAIPRPLHRPARKKRVVSSAQSATERLEARATELIAAAIQPHRPQEPATERTDDPAAAPGVAALPDDLNGQVPIDEQAPVALATFDATGKAIEPLGLSERQTLALLGPPADWQEKPPARIWTYSVETCTVKIFFYYDLSKNSFQALQLTAHRASAQTETEQCLRDVRNARARKYGS